MRSLPLLILLGLTVACAGSPSSVPSLPVTGIAGPAVANLDGPCVVAHLLPDGSITLDGQPVEPERLEETFAALAPKPEPVDGWPVPNPVALIIRADGATSWQRVRDLFYATVRPQNLGTVLFCVRHAGDGKEGTFLLGLDGGFADNRSEAHYLRTTGRFTEPAPPGAILAALAEPRRGIYVDLHPATPLSYALGLLDVLSRDNSSESSVALGWGRDRDQGPVIGMRLDGRSVPAVGGTPPVPPRSSEVAGIRLARGGGAGHWMHGQLMDEFLVTVQERGGRWEDVDALVSDLGPLASKQLEDGHWSRPGVSDARATGLAVLAFLAAGQTHKAGGHRKSVKAGLRWLKQHQAQNGRMAEDDVDHAIATWAMTRAYTQTRSPLFKQSAQAALRALKDEGGAWSVLARAEGAQAGLVEPSPDADIPAALREALAEPIGDDDPRRFLARAAKWLF